MEPAAGHKGSGPARFGRPIAAADPAALVSTSGGIKRRPCSYRRNLPQRTTLARNRQKPGKTGKRNPDTAQADAAATKPTIARPGVLSLRLILGMSAAVAVVILAIGVVLQYRAVESPRTLAAPSAEATFVGSE